MSDDRQLERAARSWLEVGPDAAPDHAVEAALLRIQTTTQERDWHVPWRDQLVNTPARLVAAAIAIAVIAVGGVIVFRPGTTNVANPGPSPTLAAPSASAATAAASPSSSVAPADYSTLPGRILVEHLGNAMDLSESSATDYNPDMRRFYFMDPTDMTSKTAVEFLPGQPSSGKSAADVSRAGTKVVFQDWAVQTRLYEANLDGTGFRKIAVDCTCALLYPDYDPSATKIVYVRVEASQSWVEIFDLATDKVTKVDSTVGPSADAVPEQPAWSPDGKTIAFSRLHWGGKNDPIVGTVRYGDVPPTSGEISLVDVGTGVVTDVPLPTTQALLPGDVNWAPDSSSLLFTHGPASTTGSNAGMPSGGARRINLDGTGYTTLPGWGGPEYLPDGIHILVQNNIFEVMNADGSADLPVKRGGMDVSDLAQGFAYIGHWIDTT